MDTPTVTAGQLVFTMPDPDRTWARVALDCDDAVVGRRRFRRTTTGWALAVPRPDLRRLEYRLLLTAQDGSVQVVCDPGNHERVLTAFGERSVALLPGYRAPEWLGRNSPPGSVERLSHHAATLGTLPVDVWAPDGLHPGDPSPLLLVHDGPEYAELARLTAYSAAMVADRILPPFRLALMSPVERDTWYAANPEYTRAELDAVETIGGSFAVTGDLVVMGASLGGLSALLVALAGRPRFRGVMAQSGSFFRAETDSQESSYPYFGRVVQAVRGVAVDRAATDRPLTVALTCGVLEENYPNNAAMATTLRRLGHRVRFSGVPDLHNYTAWRDSLHPALTDLLRSVWRARG